MLAIKTIGDIKTAEKKKEIEKAEREGRPIPGSA